MTIEPSYNHLIKQIVHYAQIRKQLAVAGMHDSGKTYLFHYLQKAYSAKYLFLDTTIQDTSDVVSLLQQDPKYSQVFKKQGVLFINFGYQVIPDIKLLNFLSEQKTRFPKFSWVLFINYHAYKQTSDYVYQKSFRLNFLSIPTLNQVDLAQQIKKYTVEIGPVKLLLHNQILKLSGGNPGLFKSLWKLAFQTSDLSENNCLEDFQIQERLKNISSELSSQEIAILNNETIESPTTARLRLFGYLNNHNQVFSPLFSKYLNPNHSKESLALSLSPSQKKLFDFFNSQPSHIVNRDQIAQVIWGNSWQEKYSDWAIDKQISDLKKVLLQNKLSQTIHTKRGQGYFLS